MKKTSKTDAAKTDAAKTDAAKTDAAKTDAAKTDAAKTDAVVEPDVYIVYKERPEQVKTVERAQAMPFPELVRSIVYAGKNRRHLLCVAHRRACAAVVSSKDVRPLHQLLTALSHESGTRKKLLDAAVHMCGGMTLQVTERGAEWIDAMGLSLIYMDSKTGKLEIRQGQLEYAKSIWSKTRLMDYDCLLVKRPVKPPVVTYDFFLDFKEKVQKKIKAGGFTDSKQACIMLEFLETGLEEIAAGKR